MRVGVISDTHGSLDPRVAEVFAGVGHIVHAGDVGRPEILWGLETIAPVTAVLGNTDSSQSFGLRSVETIAVDGCRIVVVHDRHDLAVSALPPDTCVVVSGHTHLPHIESWHGMLSVNPGSATRPRGKSGRSVALIEIENGVAHAFVVPLDAPDLAEH